jgi:hypothetical protein
LLKCLEFWKFFLNELEKDILELFYWFSFGLSDFLNDWWVENLLSKFCFSSNFISFFLSFGLSGDFSSLGFSGNFCCFISFSFVNFFLFSDKWSPVFNCFYFVDSNVLFVPSKALFELLVLENSFS